MTDGHDVGSIVGYLRLNIDDWVANSAIAEERARAIGRVNPDVHVDDNTDQVVPRLRRTEDGVRRIGAAGDGSRKPILGLWSALAMLAPAAVPVVAVLAGTLAGIGPAALAGVLGVSTLVTSFKAGAMEGSAFGTQLHGLVDWWRQLHQVAAGGLMPGASAALTELHPLLNVVTTDTYQMSSQIGMMASAGAPALVRILTQLNPLFTAFGQVLVSGAQRLNDWSKSTTSVGTFVAFVQSSLPQVLAFLGQLGTVFVHLAQASAGFGATSLSTLTLLARAFNALPIGVLQTLIPLLVAGRLAMAGYRTVTAVIEQVSGAWAALSSRVEAAQALRSAAAARAAAADAEAAAAAQTAAAEVAAAKAAEARAAAEAAAAMEASSGGTASLFAAEAESVAASKAAEAAALEEAAAAAQASAAAMNAAAAEAAAGAAAAGEAVAMSWAAVLGPIGAVAAGVGILALTLGRSSHASSDAADAQRAYTESVKESTDALNSANIAATQHTLAEKGVYQVLDQAKTLNGGLTLTYDDLTNAVNGTSAQYDKAVTAIDAATAASKKNGDSTLTSQVIYGGLKDQIAKYRQGLQDQIQTQQQLNTAMEQSMHVTDAQATKTAALYGQVGVNGVNAYLQAAQAAQKNIDQTRQQTLAFQLENDAAGLVNQALNALAGQNLSSAQAATALGQATQTMTSALQTNGDTTNTNTAAGIANRQAIEGTAQALRAKLQADAAATGSTQKATAAYNTSVAALLKSISATYGAKSAVYAYAQQLFKVPPIVSTKADLEADEATRKAQIYAGVINNVPRSITTYLNVVATGNASIIRDMTQGNATGTQDFNPHSAASTGLTWVGERGPELIQLPAHAKVYTAPQSSHMSAVAASRQGSASGVNPPTPAEITVTGPQTLTIVDADGALIGRMRVEASGVLSREADAVGRY